MGKVKDREEHNEKGRDVANITESIKACIGDEVRY
jgi:hypothetical protein